jgi:hypothetical protein
MEMFTKGMEMNETPADKQKKKAKQGRGLGTPMLQARVESIPGWQGRTWG